MKAPQRIDMSGVSLGGTKASDAQIKAAQARVAEATATAEAAKKEADAKIATATSADQIAEARAKAQKAQIDLERARFEFERLQQSGVALTEGQGKASNFYRRTVSASQDLDRLNLDPDSMIGQFGYHNVPMITSALSSDERNAYRAAVENFIAATLRLESGAAIGKDEFERQYRIYFPSPDAGPEEIEQKRRARELAIQGLRAEAGPGARQADFDLVKQGYVIPGINDQQDAGTAPAEEKPAGAGAETTTIAVPDELQAAMIEYVNAKGPNLDWKEYQSFFNRLAKQYNFNAQMTDEEAKATAEGIKGGARYGGIRPPERELTPEERGVNEALLSAPGAVATGLVNATTLGIPAMLNENIGRSVEGVREERPGYYAAGDIAGSAATTALGGAGLKAVGIGASKAGTLADLIYSATTGATGAPEGNRLSGAVANTAMAGLGSAAPGIVKRTLLPNPDDDIRILREAGVRLTPMQTVGGRPDRFEEAASRMLIGGGDVGIAARRRAFNDFNTAYLNQAGKYINFQLPNDLKPHQRMKMIGEAFDNQYDDIRSQMSVAPDQDLLDDIANLESMITDGVTFSNENAARLKTLLDDQLKRRTANPIDGQEYKSLASLLKRRKNAFAKAGNQELADGVEAMQDILDNAARRRSPPEIVQALDNTDRGFAMLAQAQEAARMAGTRPGEFSPAQILSRQRAADTRARSRAFIEGDMEGQRLAEAGQNVLGNVEPSSGTTERLAAGLTVTGGGTFLSPWALLPNAAIGMINAPGVRDILPKVFAGTRPKPVRAIGEFMEKYDEPFQRVGAAVGQQFNPTEQTPEDYASTVVKRLSPQYAPPSEEMKVSILPKDDEAPVYDPQTDTYLFKDGTRRRPDGSLVEQKSRGGIMALAQRYR